jgi:hypothetical protein
MKQRSDAPFGVPGIARPDEVQSAIKFFAEFLAVNKI